MTLQYAQYETSRVWRETAHAIRKFGSTAMLLFCLGMARTFGVYVHNVWNGQFDYAVYLWRGKMWPFPITTLTPDMRTEK